MTLTEFYHPGYARWGLRAVTEVRGQRWHYEILKRQPETRFTSDEVWEFGLEAAHFFTSRDGKTPKPRRCVGSISGWGGASKHG